MNILIAIFACTVLMATVLILAACRLAAQVEHKQEMIDLSSKQKRMPATILEWQRGTTATSRPGVVQSVPYLFDITLEESRRLKE